MLQYPYLHLTLIYTPKMLFFSLEGTFSLDKNYK